jgi:phosphatidylglycerophosphate synthase
MTSDTETSHVDRRPIKSRDTRWAEAATEGLVNFGVTPNAISVFGMLAAIAAGIMFYWTGITLDPVQRILWFCGGLLCQLRLLCNLFDGMVAVARNSASAQGEIYNEVPDRISDAAILIGLGYSFGGDVILGYVAALTAVFIAYVRAMATSIGAPNDFCGPMAKPQRMAIVTVLALYLAFSPETWRQPWSEVEAVLVIIIVGGLLTSLRRLIRAHRILA